MTTHWTANWGQFYGFTKDSPPWPLLMRAAALASRGGQALDLGAGAGRDTRYLLEQGFQVTAVDSEPRSVTLLAALPQDHLQVVQSSFEDFPFAFAIYDLISAQFALPFMPKERFATVFGRLKAALAPGGDLVVAHWRGWPAEAPQEAAEVHRQLTSDERFETLVEHLDAEFVLHVFRRR